MRSNFQLLILAFAIISLCQSSKLSKLPALNIDLVGTTVSGISSGAMMSGQIHVAHSSHIKGSAIIAGGPVGCSRGYVSFSTTECMSDPQNLSVNMVDNAINTINKQQKIDDVSNIKGSKSYIFAGLKDSVVKPQSGKHAENQFSQFGAEVKSVFDIPAEHSYVTNSYGNVCDYKGVPYVNNCSYDQAYDSLNYLYDGKLKLAAKSIPENLIEFDQTNYWSSFMSSMYSSGYVYIPSKCADGKNKCLLHIHLHGCQQSAEDLGLDYINMININPIAEANDIVVLYPQTSKNYFFPLNPYGCWDWWGYTEWSAFLAPTGYYAFNTAGLNYLTKDAIQISSIWSMATDLTSGLKKPSKLLQD